MYVRQSMPWTTGKQPLTRGGNLLVQNACLDHFRDGLSDGRRRSQLPLQSSINQSIRAWITAICRHAQLLGGVYSCSMAVEYNSSAIIDSSTTDSARTSGFPGCCVSLGSEVSDRALRRGTSPSVVFRLSVLASNPATGSCIYSLSSSIQCDPHDSIHPRPRLLLHRCG